MNELADDPDFQVGLNLEQLSASLKATIALYDDAEERHEADLKQAATRSQTRPIPLRSPCEAEMRGYWLMLHASDSREIAAVATFLR